MSGKKILNAEQLLQITHHWLHGRIPGGKARSREGWILACPMCLFMVQHIIKQHFTGPKLANRRALKRNNELRGSWHAIKKFVIGFGKSDGSPRERDHFWAIALRRFLSPRADIYEKGELFLSQIQVLPLMCSEEATLHCRPGLPEYPWCHPFLLICLPLHRGSLLAPWCCSLILPHVGYNSSENEVSGRLYSHWIAQGAVDTVRSGQVGTHTLWRKWWKERNGVRTSRFEVTWWAISSKSLQASNSMVWVFVFDNFAAFLAYMRKVC